MGDDLAGPGPACFGSIATSEPGQRDGLRDCCETVERVG
jgi:hypothetical protein